MTKNELIEELQKVEGNPQISIAIDKSWGKISYSAIYVTPLYKHDGHKVDSNACILEINAENKIYATEEDIDTTICDWAEETVMSNMSYHYEEEEEED